MQKYAKNTQKHLILPYIGVLWGVWGYPGVTETLTCTLTRDPDGFPQPTLFPRCMSTQKKTKSITMKCTKTAQVKQGNHCDQLP